MGMAVYETFPAAKRIFESADEILNFELTKLIMDGPQEVLTDTKNAQPAILTVSLAILEALKVQYLDISVIFINLGGKRL